MKTLFQDICVAAIIGLFVAHFRYEMAAFVFAFMVFSKLQGIINSR